MRRVKRERLVSYPIYSTEPSSSLKAVENLTMLVTRNYRVAYQPTLDIALNLNDQKQAIELLITLVRNNYEPAYKPALTKALEKIISQDRELRQISSKAIEALVERGQGVAKVKQLLQELRRRQNPPTEAISSLENVLWG